MISRLAVILSLLLSSFSVFALEYKHCDDLLGNQSQRYTVITGFKVAVKRDQLVLRGKLDGTNGWKVQDESSDRKIFSSRDLSKFKLNRGDEIFIPSPDRKSILLHGFFGQEETEPYLPLLYSDRDLSGLKVKPKVLTELFTRKISVVVIHNLDEEGKKRFKDELLPELKSYEEYKNNPQRFVKIGDDDEIEIGQHEYSFSGPIKTRVVSRLFSPEKAQFLQFSIMVTTNDHSIRLEPLKVGDQVFILDPFGNLIDGGRVNFPYGIKIPNDKEKRASFLEKARFFKSVIVVRSKEKS